jgi:hypothetical protein
MILYVAVETNQGVITEVTAFHTRESAEAAKHN